MHIAHIISFVILDHEFIVSPRLSQRITQHTWPNNGAISCQQVFLDFHLSGLISAFISSKHLQILELYQRRKNGVYRSLLTLRTRGKVPLQKVLALLDSGLDPVLSNDRNFVTQSYWPKSYLGSVYPARPGNQETDSGALFLSDNVHKIRLGNFWLWLWLSFPH